MGGITILVLLAMIVVYSKEDKEGPVITFATQELTYREGSDTKTLLDGVMAYDHTDGDVSNSLLVESIIPLRDSTTARVTYAARDSNYHITKESIIVHYMAINDKPDQEHIELENTKREVTEYKDIDQTDINQKDIEQVDSSQNNIEQEDIEPEGIEPVSIEQESIEPEDIEQVSIEQEYIEHENFDQQDEEQEEMMQQEPVIELIDTQLYLEIGEKFDPMDMVKGVFDDKDETNDLYRNILIEGVYHRNKAGTYILEYYVMDSDGNFSRSVYLKLYVT